MLEVDIGGMFKVEGSGSCVLWYEVSHVWWGGLYFCSQPFQVEVQHVISHHPVLFPAVPLVFPPASSHLPPFLLPRAWAVCYCHMPGRSVSGPPSSPGAREKADTFGVPRASCHFSGGLLSS